MLTLNNIEVIYNDVILVLKGLSMEVPEGKIVGLLGSNGAGKSTTLKSISGLLKPENGEVTDGNIEFYGQPIQTMDAADIVKKGIFQVMEGRRVFEHLTVEENLISGAYTRKDRARLKKDMDLVYSYFPPLKARINHTAGDLSGGEQQMLAIGRACLGPSLRAWHAGAALAEDVLVAIGRALMAKPKLMMLDEPSLGLAPMLVREIFGIIERINKEQNTTILLVEQNANLALNVADYAYIMENGRIVLEGEPKTLKENADVREFYLGLTEVGKRKSYRDVKHYKRRKRWLS